MCSEDSRFIRATSTPAQRLDYPMTFRFRTFLSPLLLSVLAFFHHSASAVVITDPATKVAELPTTLVGGPAIVYQITFDSDEEKVNYSPYESGYYIAPSEGGSGTLLLTKSKGTAKSLYVYTDFGQLFIAQEGDTRKGVITCTAATNVSTTAFFAMGNADDTLAIDNGSIVANIYYAREMKGYAVSGDAQPDQLFLGATSTDDGVYGLTHISAVYDDADSNNAFQNNLSVASLVSAIQKRLTTSGFTLAQQNTTSTASPPTSGTSTLKPADAQIPVVDKQGKITTPTPVTIGPGDVLVYSLSFKKTGDSINYGHPLGGFFVTTATATETSSNNKAGPSSGALILEVSGTPSKYVRTFPNFGTSFVAKSQSNRKGVLFATDANSVSSTFFCASGDARDTMELKTPSGNINAYFARKLTGYAFSADSQYDLEFVGAPASDLGVAGVSALTLNYEENRTQTANKRRRTVAEEATEIELKLKSEGFVVLTSGN